MFLVCSAFGLCIGCFSLFHFGLAAFNYTTIELQEKRGFLWNVNKQYRNIYNKGIFENLCAVLGPQPWLWFVPVLTLPQDGGLYYPVNDAHIS